MLDLTCVVTDSNFIDDVKVYRTASTWVEGRLSNTTTNFNIYASVQALSPKEIMTMPEGDRISGAMHFYTTTQIYRTQVTNANVDGYLSDMLEWQNKKYRVKQINEWGHSGSGWYKIVGVYMEGA